MNTEYLTPAQVAARLRVDDYTVRGWIRTGILEAEAIRQGKRVRYRIKRPVVEAIERRQSPSGVWLHPVSASEPIMQT